MRRKKRVPAHDDDESGGVSESKEQDDDDSDDADVIDMAALLEAPEALPPSLLKHLEACKEFAKAKSKAGKKGKGAGPGAGAGAGHGGGATLEPPPPYRWQWNTAGGGTAKPPKVPTDLEGDFFDDAGLPADLEEADIIQRILQQWDLFVRFHDVKGNLRRITPSDRQRLPGYYWVRTREFWPDLSELMLYWLCVPVSTCGLERGFSFQTLIDADTRRRRLGSEHLRDDMMVHLHRDFLDGTLEREL